MLAPAGRATFTAARQRAILPLHLQNQVSGFEARLVKAHNRARSRFFCAHHMASVMAGRVGRAQALPDP